MVLFFLLLYLFFMNLFFREKGKGGSVRVGIVGNREVFVLGL